MSKIAIIYHSGFGHTKVLAEKVFQGVMDSDLEATMFSVDELSENLSELADFNGLIFGSPTYMGSVSAPFKMFMDKSSGIWARQEWKDKIAGGFTNSGSMSGDKFNTLVQMVTFACQHGMIWVSQDTKNESSPSGNPSAVNRIGSFIGAMAQSDNLSPEETPPIGDQETARLLGLRVAKIVKRFN